MPTKEKAKVSAKQPAQVSREAKTAAGEQVTPFPTGEVGEERIFYRWKAPVRPFKKRDREYYTTIAAIAFLIIIILGFLREFLLIAVVVAFAFVSYVLAAVKPEETEHQLTSRGIRTANKLYRWSDLRRYWFSEKYGQAMVMIQTVVLFPGQLLMLLSGTDKEKVRKILNERLPYEQPEQTFLDKSADWLSKKVPLEKESTSSAGKSAS
ncbi:MAG: hypothetical protein A2900_00745 [Candidatus Chisholmbacteria bacterium RIFCSPLOWO2_01_FULL_50_28]|uniref:DUF5673 domain-containing protein n=1 Tax=Candidatus Chisholmbacteria bacterium RIFCSPHIGHO2_01_FULL_52_32 TaxID=1797591 RepID=A0A1G1VRH3_9BACT|nr:MAG: hypothetical protein A2786_00235 [Candidatus Chisholmbacteria bacterium RIFCSPHIGHO2_01_FULL_52_32]OGY19619.1 MAG: hypothetical protein A2900_00745 [Candidatus Chisholmbacteria bacterium RIFCSPLOWO2_01_FULL_50_28]